MKKSLQNFHKNSDKKLRSKATFLKELFKITHNPTRKGFFSANEVTNKIPYT